MPGAGDLLGPSAWPCPKSVSDPVRILVLGGGVVGVTAAWYLSRDGHEVTVVDRQPGPALETSFANGGQISVSYAEPWANPGAPLKILQWLAHGVPIPVLHLV